MRGIRFKVWETIVDDAGNPKPQFYAHLSAGNGQIVWQSEGYDDIRSAFQACTRTWRAVGKAWAPELSPGPKVPYAKDSRIPTMATKIRHGDPVFVP